MSIAQNFPEIRPSLNLDFANVKALDSRVSFARASTGAYYDGQTVAKAEENLFQQSQTFGTTWTTERATITENTTSAPDGTSTADSLLQAAGQTVAGNAQQAASVIANDYVISAFAKPNGKNFLIIRETLADGTLRNTWFDVLNGTIGTTNASHTATISASTNGFYRCSIKLTVNAARSAIVRLSVADSDNSTTVVDSGGLYLWGAQLEQRSAPTAYTPTTTQPVTNYIPVLETASANVARFDHNPVTGESLGLLVEEQRTNLLTYSEDFADASWSKGDVTLQSNVIIAPDGTLTGDLLNDASVSFGSLNKSVSLTNSAYTFSVYIKSTIVATNVRLDLYTAVGEQLFVIFNSATGAYVSGSAVLYSTTPVGNNWYRVSLSATGSGTTFARIYPSGDSAGATGGIYIWGAQLEAGAFPTSYIPTVASQVTRSADNASMTGANFSEWYRADQGAFYVEAMSDEVGSRRVFAVTDGSAYTQRISSYFGAATHFRLRNESSGLNIDLDAGTQTAGVFGKVAASYAIGAQAVSLNGGTVASATDTRSMPLVDRLFIGADAFNTNRLNGHIRKLSYYTARLTNTQLQALTS